MKRTTTIRRASPRGLLREIAGLPRRKLGVYVRADGSNSPARFKIRSPCFHNLSTLPEIAEGEYVADLIASLGSLDIVLGSVDR